MIVKETNGKETFLSPRYSSRDEARAHCDAINPIRARGGATVRVALCGPANAILSDTLFSGVEKAAGVKKDIATAHETIVRAKSLLTAAPRGLVDERAIRQSINDLNLNCDVNLHDRAAEAFQELGRELQRLSNLSVDIDGLGRLSGDEPVTPHDALLASNQRAALVTKLETMAVKIRRCGSAALSRKGPRMKPDSNHRYAIQQGDQRLKVGSTPNGLQKGITNLLALSESQDPFTAMQEWEWAGEEIDTLDKRFPVRCEFCHTTNLLKAYLVMNRKNSNSAWVGSECVVRYTRPEGTSTVEEARSRFNHDLRQKHRMETIQRLIAELLQDAKGKISFDDLEALHKAVRNYFGVRDVADIRWANYHDHMSEIVGVPWSQFDSSPETKRDAALIYSALFAPQKVLRRRTTRKEPDVRQFVGGRRRQVSITIARGEHTRPADRGISD